MKILIATTFALLLLFGCAAEKGPETATAETTTTATETLAAEVPSTTSAAETATTAETSTASDEETETWAGQLKVAQPVSTFNYVGAESGDWVPMRFRNDSEVGKKILAVCGNEDMCEFTGAIEMLDEAPPQDASAVAQIVRVDSVKRLPADKP